jgi:hypothetical protein
MMAAIAHGATTDELLSDLRLVQAEFERLDQPHVNSK